MSRSAPTEEERTALTRRADELRASLTPAEANEIGTEVLRLMAGYPSVRLTHEEAARLATTFVAALTGMPLWAIRKACMNWATGRAQGSNAAFPPSAPELRMAADTVARPRQYEAGSIRAILSATVEVLPSEEARAKALAHWEEVRPTMKGMPPPVAPAAPGHNAPRPSILATDGGGEEEARREREREAQLHANRRTLEREIGRPLKPGETAMTRDMQRLLGVMDRRQPADPVDPEEETETEDESRS